MLGNIVETQVFVNDDLSADLFKSMEQLVLGLLAVCILLVTLVICLVYRHP